MKKSILILLMGAALLFSLAIKTRAQSEAELKQKIEKINAELNKANMEGKFLSVLDKYYTTDVISMPNFRELTMGIEALRKAEESMADPNPKNYRIETTILQIQVHGNLIFEVGKYKIIMNKESDNALDDYGKYFTIWEKQKDGSLKVKVETWNTDRKEKEEK